MPLESGPGSFKRNVRTLMGEVGKSPHVQSRQQALAIAYSKERGRADGGDTAGDTAGLIDREQLPQPEEPAKLVPMSPALPEYINTLERLQRSRSRAQGVPGQKPTQRRWSGGPALAPSPLAAGGAVIAPGDDSKVSKQSVHYSKGMRSRRCGICRFFILGGKCKKVRGDIDPQMWCKLYKDR